MENAISKLNDNIEKLKALLQNPNCEYSKEALSIFAGTLVLLAYIAEENFGIKQEQLKKAGIVYFLKNLMNDDDFVNFIKSNDSFTI